METDGYTYVGPPDMHDATILWLDRIDDSLVVGIRSCEKREFHLRFRGVTKVESRNPKGMMLYSLSRRGAYPPYRFVFMNWDEDDVASLEVTAEGFEAIE